MQKGSDPHTARVRSVSESTGACESTPAAGDCKRELLPRAAPRSQRWHSGIARQGHSRMRVGQVADAMRVRAGVAPRVASGDRAASKGKPAGGCSSFKRRVEREERCAAPHALTALGACVRARRWAGREIWAGKWARRRLRARGGAAATCRSWTTSRWPLPPPLTRGGGSVHRSAMWCGVVQKLRCRSCDSVRVQRTVWWYGT